MKYTQVDSNVLKQIQFNAGVLCSNFNTFTGEITGIIGATSGGISASIVPTTTDYGEDIDNVKKNTYELKRIDSWEAKISGTFVAASKATIKTLLASVTETTETPTSGVSSPTYSAVQRLSPNDQFVTTVGSSDFGTIWWVGDYSDDNSSTSGKYIAIRFDNTINTAGFTLKTADKAKGQFSFEFLAHYSLNSDNIPFAVYIVENTTTNSNG